MKSKFDECFKNRKIIKSLGMKERIEAEIKSAKEDLKEAKNRLRAKRFKYATVNAYYSLFHSARALLYKAGYRERSHRCLREAIFEFYVKEKLLDVELIDYFDEALGLREAADYSNIFSKDGARRAIEGAKIFLSAAREILKS